jgi:predicted MFS family arabinose efflux permease
MPVARADFRTSRRILILGLAPAIGLGMARFAYAIILPDMKTSLEWTYAQAGFMNTVNAAGYLAGAVFGAAVVARLHAFRTLLLGALLCAAMLLVSAATSNFILLSMARTAAGIAAAFTFVGGGALAAAVSQQSPKASAFLLALFYTGPGIGFILSGLSLPVLLQHSGPGSWWIGWAALAALSLALTAILPLAASADAPRRPDRSAEGLSLGPFASYLTGYVTYGAGISAYLTFVIAWLAETGQSAWMQSATWTAIGLGALCAPWIWHTVIAKREGGQATAIIVFAAMVGAAIPLIVPGPFALVASAFVAGSACFTVVAATTAFVRRNFRQELWPAGIAIMTSCFAAGQMLGPIAAGSVTDQYGLLASGLWCSVGLLAGAVVLTGIQRDALGAHGGAHANGREVDSQSLVHARTEQ